LQQLVKAKDKEKYILSDETYFVNENGGCVKLKSKKGMKFSKNQEYSGQRI